VPGPYLIEELITQGGRITVRPGEQFRRRFTGTAFTVDYGPDVDLADVRREILAIPFLLNVLPAVWLSGETYRIRRLDQELSTSLPQVREAYQRLFPARTWDGDLIADEHVAHAKDGRIDGENVAVLFSGGLDSVYTSLTHRAMRQLPITILSMLGVYDWRDSAACQAARNHFIASAARHGHEPAFVTSNLDGYLPIRRLVDLWPDPRRWMVEVQHGLGFVGLAIPLMESRGVRRLLMAGCEADHYGMPWGSHPKIVGALRWSGGEVVQDGLDVTRQKKVQRIISMCAEPDVLPPAIKSCLRPTDGFRNCGFCSKCLQTALALYAEGADPNAFGFDLSLDRTLRYLRERLRSQRFSLLHDADLAEWKDIQEAVRRRLNVARDADETPGDLRWFAVFDWDAYSARLDAAEQGAMRRVRRRMGLWIDARPRLRRPIRALMDRMLK